jgi:alpha-tubulin suppressor-like RCC1 family protein
MTTPADLKLRSFVLSTALIGGLLFASLGTSGCHSSAIATNAEIDVTVDVDAALALDHVTITATAPTKMPLPKTFAVTSATTSVEWTVKVAGVTTGFEATVTAAGIKGADTLVTYAATAQVGPGQTVAVHLKLTTRCTSVSCAVGLQCDDGTCTPPPSFHPDTDGGAPGDGSVDVADGSTPDVSDGRGIADAGPDTHTDSGSERGPDSGLDTASEAGSDVAGDLPPEAPPKIAKGDACQATAECQAGLSCDDRDKVCCDSACADTCMACTKALTGQSDGTCAAVTAGKDPYDDCAQTVAETCGTDGTCDGKGTCNKYGNNQACSPAKCSGTQFTPAGSCDGTGQCAIGPPSDCMQSTCSATNGCTGACATDTDCLTGSYCQGTTCTVKKNNGDSCAQGHECKNNFCVDSFCCENACNGACMACSAALTGSTTSGRCLPVTNGQDPHSSCAPDSTICGRDGACDGNGACRVATRGLTCGDPICATSTSILTTAATCDGAGICGPGTAGACPNSLKCASATTCKTSCAADADCLDGSYCASGACIPKKTSGQSCSAGNQCGSTFCVDQTCCDQACNGVCQACGSGTCTAVKGGDDPDHCPGTCDTDGTCRAKQGQTCQTVSVSAGCVSTSFCAPDGYCCDQKCGNSCQACDISGSLGICTSVANGPPHGNRTSCGTDAQCAGTCNGLASGLCSYPTKNCSPGPGCSGTSSVGQSACSGGTCATPAPQSCAMGYICSGTACKTSCASDADCLPSYFCSGNTCHLDAVAISSGGAHTCALLVDGTIRCWGANGNGQLGNGTMTSSLVPVGVSGLSGVTAISAGNVHTCALLSDSTVRCWGGTYTNALELGNGGIGPSAIPVVVTGLSSVTAISAGNGNTCALISGGAANCWGFNSNGQFGNNTTISSGIPVGGNGLTGVVAISVGGSSVCALLSDGTIRCWGDNRSGELGNGTLTSSLLPTGMNSLINVTAISASDFPNCALLSNGTLSCWGYNASGALGNGDNTDLYSDVPVAVSGLGGVGVLGAVLAISSGDGVACALLSGGSVVCWGFGGSLGDGTSIQSSVPVAVKGLSGVTKISAGSDQTCALLSNGSVSCWGLNFAGNLGNGTTDNVLIPVAVNGW